MINEKKLKEIRQQKRLTQLELAREINVSVDAISLLERDKVHNPCLRTLISIANYFDVSIDWLTDRSNIQYLSQFEIALVQKLRANKLNVIALKKALNYYDNPTELGEVQKKIHGLIPNMDLETAKSALHLLTNMVTVTKS